MKFRKLKANEIECRVSQVKPNGVILLLYKDARVDMNILDETVGCMNWQKEYSRDNANCTVSIWDDDKKQWIRKEDTGTESRTEAEKGLASDAFKRACFNWGLGRELYTAPFIWVGSDKCNISGNKCYDKFDVTEIGYDDEGRINKCVIANEKTKQIVYEYGTGRRVPAKKPAPKKPAPEKEQQVVPADAAETIDREQAAILKEKCKEKGQNLKQLLAEYRIHEGRMGNITVNQFNDMIDYLESL